jgi:hypothetical protein
MYADESQLRRIDVEGNANGKNCSYCAVNCQPMFGLTES